MGGVRGWIRAFVVIAIWTGLLVAVARGWREVSGVLPAAGASFPIAVSLIVIGYLGGSASWSALQESRLRGRSFRAFVVGQAAKYLPTGGLAQALGQIGLTSTRRSDHASVTVLFLVHSAVQVYAALLVASLLIVAETRIAPAGALVGAIAGASLFMRRSILMRAVDLAGRLFARIEPHISDAVPSTGTLWMSCGFGTIPLVLSGAAWGLLGDQWGSIADGLSTMGAFSLAWVAGYVVVFLPSGLGVRELAMAALMPGLAASEVIGLSLLHRFATLVAELFLLAVVSRRGFARSGRDD